MIDKELAQQIASFSDDIHYSASGHKWKGITPEHSLEVQIPFLQFLFPAIKIVPIVMGTQDFETQDILTKALSDVLAKTDKKYLIVASTDLSHFHSAEEAEAKDKPLVRTFARYDYFALQNLIAVGEYEACGAGPLTTTMMTAEQLGAVNAAPVMYIHSGDTDAGKDRQDRVVGYFSGVYVRSQEAINIAPWLEENDKIKLMEHVKKSVEKAAKGEKDTAFYGMVPRNLAQMLPAFVTLKKNDQLRACMGHTFAQKPIILEVQNAAELAATQDYRFGPIEIDELDDIEYEITVMSRMKRVFNFDEIQIGRDGLFIRKGSNRGLLLPQVASERSWDVETFLQNLSQKAGLQPNDYLETDAQIFRFEAIIFNDKELSDENSE